MQSVNQKRVTKLITGLERAPQNAFKLAFNFVVGELKDRAREEGLTLLPKKMLKKLLAVLPNKEDSGLTQDQVIRKKLKDAAPIFIEGLISSGVAVTGVAVPARRGAILNLTHSLKN